MLRWLNNGIIVDGHDASLFRAIEYPLLENLIAHLSNLNLTDNEALFLLESMRDGFQVLKIMINDIFQTNYQDTVTIERFFSLAVDNMDQAMEALNSLINSSKRRNDTKKAV